MLKTKTVTNNLHVENINTAVKKEKEDTAAVIIITTTAQRVFWGGVGGGQGWAQACRAKVKSLACVFVKMYDHKFQGCLMGATWHCRRPFCSLRWGRIREWRRDLQHVSNWGHLKVTDGFVQHTVLPFHAAYKQQGGTRDLVYPWTKFSMKATVICTLAGLCFEYGTPCVNLMHFNMAPGRVISRRPWRPLAVQALKIWPYLTVSVAVPSNP